MSLNRHTPKSPLERGLKYASGFAGGVCFPSLGGVQGWVKLDFYSINLKNNLYIF